LPDRVAIGVLTKTFPPGLVDAVIDEAQARELRETVVAGPADHVLHPGDVVVA
jgi:hypothetical protein